MQLELILLVIALSLVQSIFGVGLLVFGTPILILIGLDFADLLWVLLPASLGVSVSQLVTDRYLNRAFLRDFSIWAVPGVALGLFAILTHAITMRLELLVASILIAVTILRHSAACNLVLLKLSTRYSSLALATMGFVHGFSNMGGGLLSAYAAALYSDKRAIRHAIAVGYVIFAAVQMIVLLTAGHETNYSFAMGYAIIGSVVYLTAGHIAFRAINDRRFKGLFSIFMTACAAALIYKWLTT